MMVSADNDPRRAGTIWAFDPAYPPPAITARLGAVFSRCGAEAVPELAAAMRSTAPAEILKRFEGGRRCYAARVEGRIACYGWVSFEEEMVGELSLRVRLSPGEAYVWDCATLPDYRGRRLYTALLAHILEKLRAEQIKRVWIGVDLENLASQRGIERAGFQRVAYLVVERVLALRLVWAQAYPGAPDALVAEARRVFLGDRDKLWLDALSTYMHG